MTPSDKVPRVFTVEVSSTEGYEFFCNGEYADDTFHNKKMIFLSDHDAIIKALSQCEGFETCVKFVSGQRPNNGEDYNPIFNKFRSDASIWSDIKNLETKTFIELAALTKANAENLVLREENARLSKDWECCSGNDAKVKEHTQDCPKYGNVEWLTKLHNEEIQQLEAELSEVRKTNKQMLEMYNEQKELNRKLAEQLKVAHIQNDKALSSAPFKAIELLKRQRNAEVSNTDFKNKEALIKTYDREVDELLTQQSQKGQGDGNL